MSKYSPYPKIVHCHVSGNLILMKDENNNLWLQGLDYHSRLLSEGSMSNPQPIKLPFNLDRYEIVGDAYNNTDILAILIVSKTSKAKKLYLAEVKDSISGPPEILFRHEPFVNVQGFSAMGRTVIFGALPGGIFIYNNNLRKTGRWLQDINAYDLVTIYDKDSNIDCMQLRIDISDLSADGGICNFGLNHVNLCINGQRVKKSYTKKGKTSRRGIVRQNKQTIRDSIVLYQYPDIASEMMFKFIRFTVPITTMRKYRTYINRISPKFVVMIDGVAFTKKRGEGSLVKIDRPGVARIINKNMEDYQELVFVEGTSIYNSKSVLKIKLNSTIEPKQIRGILGSDFLITKDRTNSYQINGEIMVVSLKNKREYGIIKYGILFMNQGFLYLITSQQKFSAFLTPHSVETTAKGKTFHIYQLLSHLPLIDNLCISSDTTAIIQSYGIIYRIEFPLDSHINCWRLVASNLHSMVVNEQIIYQYVSPEDKIRSINPQHCPLDILCRYVDKIPCGYTPNFGNGEQNLQDLVTRALDVFQDRYLLAEKPRTSFKRDVSFDAERLFKIGQVLHMAIVFLRTPLKFRLPLSVLTAIKEREPIISELEYYAKVWYGDDLDQNLSSEPNSYKHHLLSILNYDPSLDCQISRELADGIKSYSIIINFESMNIPTLDVYLSGPIIIDRNNFKDSLKGPRAIENLLDRLIDTISEQQLKDLIHNWSGSPIVSQDYNYNLAYNEECDNIAFNVDTVTLYIPPALVRKSKKLIEIKDFAQMFVRKD